MTAPNSRTMYRQGDILLVCATSLPPKAKPLPRDARHRVVLALGETTGHAHALLDRDVTLYETEDAARFLDIRRAAATLVHEEHGAITVPPGVYRVVRQREYAPEAIRTVAD